MNREELNSPGHIKIARVLKSGSWCLRGLEMRASLSDQFTSLFLQGTGRLFEKGVCHKIPIFEAGVGGGWGGGGLNRHWTVI